MSECFSQPTAPPMCPAYTKKVRQNRKQPPKTQSSLVKDPRLNIRVILETICIQTAAFINKSTRTGFFCTLIKPHTFQPL